MTTLYFVRHAQPDYRQGNNRTFALSEEGRADRLLAAAVLEGVSFDIAVSSPYTRSIETIEPVITAKGLRLETDERLRERDNNGGGSNSHEMFRRRWADFDFHEENGESLRSTQQRNVAAVFDILDKYEGKTVLVGTHGTALATIINYFRPDFLYDGFMRIIDYMPYVLRADFEGRELKDTEELFYLKKEFHGVK